jgi:hypothetical protein
MKYEIWSGIVLIAAFVELKQAIHFCINCYDEKTTAEDIEIRTLVSKDPSILETVFRCTREAILVIKAMIPPPDRYLWSVNAEDVEKINKLLKGKRND